MDFYTNNPFAGGTIFTLSDGSQVLDRQPLNYPGSINDRYFDLTETDTLSDISLEAYGDSKWYWVIAEVNDIFFSLDLPEPGTTLLIPDLDVVKMILE